MTRRREIEATATTSRADDEFRERAECGWSLPLGAERGAALRGRAEPITDTARLVLGVVPGERPLLAEFGCAIHRMPALESPAERQVAAALVEEALERWVPWLGVERAEVVAVAEDGRYVRLALRARGRWSEMELELRPTPRVVDE